MKGESVFKCWNSHMGWMLTILTPEPKSLILSISAFPACVSYRKQKWVMSDLFNNTTQTRLTGHRGWKGTSDRNDGKSSCPLWNCEITAEITETLVIHFHVLFMVLTISRSKWPTLWVVDEEKWSSVIKVMTDGWERILRITSVASHMQQINLL